MQTRLGQTIVVPILALVAFAWPDVAAAQTVFYNPDFEYVVDIPVGWELLEAENTSLVSFTDPDRVAVFQVVSFPGSQFVTVEEIDEYVRGTFGAGGDAAPYRYNRDFAIFADYAFVGGSVPVRGYMSMVNRTDFDFVVMAFAAEEYYQQLHDYLLSALDSFSPTAATRNVPGPVSQFFLPWEDGDYIAGDAAPTLALPGGTSFAMPPMLAGADHIDAAAVLVEREARILSRFTPMGMPGDTSSPWVNAWRRYYRLVYRENFERLAPLSEAIYVEAVRSGLSRDEMPAHILAWLQSATYKRARGLSDFMTPGACLTEFAGDCDSLGIVYATILHQLGFDAILMVSNVYSHAMVGIDMAGEGARFPYEGRRWLVAELTDDVALGRIAQDMADPAGWVGIKLDPTVQW